MDSVHTANKIYKSTKSPEIQQNSGLFCFQTLAKNPIKKQSKKAKSWDSKNKRKYPTFTVAYSL